MKHPVPAMPFLLHRRPIRLGPPDFDEAHVLVGAYCLPRRVRGLAAHQPLLDAETEVTRLADSQAVAS